MESPAFIDDEVIADSEGEMEQDIYPMPSINKGQYIPQLDTFRLFGMTTAAPGSSNPYRASSVSEFSALPSHFQPAKAISSISAFTAGPSVLPDHPARFTSPGVFSDKGKEKAADTSITEFVPMPGTIADRAKTRQRTQKPLPRYTSDVIELTSDEDDDELGLKPSKPQPKPKPKPKAKEPMKPKQVQNTPNPTSASDPPPRPRPRPRPKRPKFTEEPASAFAPGAGPFPLTSTPPMPSHGPEIPIATSPPMPMPHQNWHTRLTTDHTTTFDLPPSDPPMPSFPAEHGVPRIETLPADRPSSPSSLFSELSTTSKSNKRKRAQPDMDAEIDELATSQGAPNNVGVGLGRAHISPRMMGPPPTFFAGSSTASSPMRSVGGGVNTTPSNQIPPSEVVDLTMLPPTLAPLKAKKPRKPKKASAPIDDDDDEAAISRAIVLDEDDQDEDFNPTGESATKKKGKSRAKEKAPKPTKSKGKTKESAAGISPPKAQVEVVIATKSKKGPTKNKGKQKDSASAADKEVFKSREFIEDSDDELQLAGSAAAATAGDDNLLARSNSAVALTPPTMAGGLSISSAPAAPSNNHNPSNSPLLPDANTQAEMMKGDNPPPSRRGNKKRKAIVKSDAEEEATVEGGVAHVNASPSATKKKRKTGDGDKNEKSKKLKDKKGTKRVLLSDEEEGDAYKAVDDDEGPNNEKRTKKTPRKVPRKVIDDDDDEPAGEDRQPSPEKSRDSTKV